MDYSLPTLFIVPSAGTMATGTSDTLTTGQLGVFLNGGMTLGTAGNVVGKKFQIMQGRVPDEKVRLGSKKSGVISKENVMEWYKVAPKTGSGNTAVTLTVNKLLKCDEHYTLTMRFSSFYTNAVYANGRVDSVFVDTPCCDCATEPCATLSVEEVGTVLAELVAKANAKWGAYATFALSGTGDYESDPVDPFVITITSVALTSYQTQCALFQPSLLDEMFLFPYFYKGPENSQDYIIESEKCGNLSTVAVTSTPTFGYGKANDLRIMEYQNHAYQHDWKHLSVDNLDWNTFFTSFVDGDDYTMYVIKYKNTSSNYTWASYVQEDHITMIAFPSVRAAQATAFETILTAALGAPIAYPAGV